MVKGPCRGALCDFWARAKLRKYSVEDLITKAKESIRKCRKDNGGTSIDEALNQFWADIGIKSLGRLSEEEPSLFKKIQLVEAALLS